MPGKSSRSKTKSIRFPIEVWAEVEATAARHDLSFNEEIIRRCVAMRDKRYRAPEVAGQTSLDDFLGQ